MFYSRVLARLTMGNDRMQHPPNKKFKKNAIDKEYVNRYKFNYKCIYIYAYGCIFINIYFMLYPSEHIAGGDPKVL